MKALNIQVLFKSVLTQRSQPKTVLQKINQFLVVPYLKVNFINEPRHVNFQLRGILTSVDSEEPGQPPFKLRNSK